MPTDHIYLGYINSDPTEGRGRMVAVMAGIDLDLVDEKLAQVAGYTGRFIQLVQVNPPTPSLVAGGGRPPRVVGTWTNELGQSITGKIPAVQPQRWDAQKVKRFERLRRKFPHISYQGPDGPYLADTLPRPAGTDHRALHLLITSSDPGDRVELVALYTGREDALSGAEQLRTANPRAGRIHIACTRTDSRVLQFWLNDPALDPLARQGGKPRAANRGTEIVWSEPDEVRHQGDPELAEYQRMLAELT